LAKQGFEVRLIEGGALAIFDLRYPHGRPLRELSRGREDHLTRLSKLVFDNADRIGRWLEHGTDEDEPPVLHAASFEEAAALIKAVIARRDRSR
jgi:hypothetical protein